MATPPLLEPADLTDFPGAPFTAGVVESAASAVRLEAGWHIAPSVTETLTVVARGGRLFLPTLQLTGVTSITDLFPETPEALDVADWDWLAAGVLWRRGRSLIDGRRYEVAFTHGYETTPADLRPVVAAVAQAYRQGGASVRLGSLSITPGDRTADQHVTPYRIPRSR